MGVVTKLQPIDREIDALIASHLSPRGQSVALAAFARTALTGAETQNARALGGVPPHDTFVDGRREAPLESVRPDGTILFEFRLMGEVFEWIEAQLVLNAPVRSGRFARSFVFFADGVEVDAQRSPPATEYVFLNVQPYARKIERGLSAKAPAGVFQTVAVLANRRFGSLARVRFGYRAPLAGAVARGRAARADVRTPAIVIAPR